LRFPASGVTVSGFVELREESQHTDRFVLRVDRIDGGRIEEPPRRVRLSVKRGMAPAPGSFVEVKASLDPPLQPLEPGRLRQIAVLMTYAEGDPDGQTRLTAFLNTFRDIGWIDGRNYQIIIRWAGGELERVRRFVSELVALAPDVMVVMSTPALVAAQKETKTIPSICLLLAESGRPTVCRQCPRFRG
ncbi:MAG: hypothetical protein WCB70_10565, partial [Xanthobacteraceae bacterium]